MQVCDLPSVFSLSYTNALLLMQAHISFCWKSIKLLKQRGAFIVKHSQKNAMYLSEISAVYKTRQWSFSEFFVTEDQF